MDDVDFDTPDAGVTGAVGNKTSGGGARPAVFTLSPEVRARLDGESTTGPGGGSLEAYIWNVNGSDDPAAVFSGGKKEYYYFIDEDSNTFLVPSF
jgi:hypothetical protein